MLLAPGALLGTRDPILEKSFIHSTFMYKIKYRGPINAYVFRLFLLARVLSIIFIQTLHCTVKDVYLVQFCSHEYQRIYKKNIIYSESLNFEL